MSYQVKLTKNAQKDFYKIKSSNLSEKAKLLIDVIRENPYQNPPPYEKLCGNLTGKYSKRINIQHRLVYSVREEEQIVVVSSMWSHYESEK